jgi:exonuclease V
MHHSLTWPFSACPQSIHKVLEREIRPKEIRVEAVTDEERWALRYVRGCVCCPAVAYFDVFPFRLVNMLSGLHTLMSLGCTVSRFVIWQFFTFSDNTHQREMPVFGVVHGQIVVGVIVRTFSFPLTADIKFGDRMSY